jgi:ABC-type lipoprotein release transport system permease subunit
LIASVIFGVEPTDGAMLAVVIATTTLVAALASGVPASRAARLNPKDMLAQE